LTRPTLARRQVTAFEHRQLKAIRAALDSDVAARTTPATAATGTTSQTLSPSKHQT
jgi:hypothetical protein